MDWKIRDENGRLKDFNPQLINDYLGFVYCITNKTTSKKYIGKKLFWNQVKLKPLKGYKKKRLTVKQSNWKHYTGSCKALNEEISILGTQSYSFTILHLCKTKFDLSYVEMVEQIRRKVLFSDDYYNGIINVRLNNKGANKSDFKDL